MPAPESIKPTSTCFFRIVSTHFHEPRGLLRMSPCPISHLPRTKQHFSNQQAAEAAFQPLVRTSGLFALELQRLDQHVESGTVTGFDAMVIQVGRTRLSPEKEASSIAA